MTLAETSSPQVLPPSQSLGDIVTPSCFLVLQDFPGFLDLCHGGLFCYMSFDDPKVRSCGLSGASLCSGFLGSIPSIG